MVRARRIAIYATVALLLITAATLVLSAPAALAWWKPLPQLSWYWQLTGTVNNSYPAAAYDIDGFDNSQREVATLHSAKKHVICYIDVGTWENWRSDASKFPSSVLGKQNGWPGERWLDVRQLAVLEPLMTARFEMCRQKGFDAIEPDNMDGYENDTGFNISAQDQLSYDQWVAKKAHSLGLAVFQKNDPEQATKLQPEFRRGARRAMQRVLRVLLVPALPARRQTGAQRRIQPLDEPVLRGRQPRRDHGRALQRQPRRHHLPAVLERLAWFRFVR